MVCLLQYIIGIELPMNFCLHNSLAAEAAGYLTCYYYISTQYFCHLICFSLISLSRRRLHLAESQAFYLIVNRRTIISTSMTLAEVYHTEKDSDGFLYITYAAQEIFGWCWVVLLIYSQRTLITKIYCVLFVCLFVVVFPSTLIHNPPNPASPCSLLHVYHLFS